MVNAYEIMREWDREVGIEPWDNHELDIDIPGSIKGDFDDWKAALEDDDIEAIIEGRTCWGLPIFC